MVFGGLFEILGKIVVQAASLYRTVPLQYPLHLIIKYSIDLALTKLMVDDVPEVAQQDPIRKVSFK